jgi:uncharacterized ion transporter superfamily protein YfcC
MNRKTIDPLLLLGSVILIAAALTWVIPSGQYERSSDSRTGAITVVPGSYHGVPSHPVGIGGVLLSIPRGLVGAASIIFYVLLSGAALTVVELTGAIGAILDSVATQFARRPLLVLTLISPLFLFGGAAYSMSEEIIAFIPLLCALMRRLHLPNTMAVAVSFGSATVAAAFSPFNTYLLGISQPILGLRLFSGFAFRSVVFSIAIGAWVGYLMWQARRTRTVDLVVDIGGPEVTSSPVSPVAKLRHRLVLAILMGGMGLIVLGCMLWSWDIPQCSAAFVAIGVLAGLGGGLKARGTAEAFAEGFRRIALAALLAGIARAVSVILEQGMVLDTITELSFRPLHHLPPTGTGVMMLTSESLLGLPMPSDAGKAMLALPILAPLSDLLHISRQAVALSYQYCTLMSLMTPTYGAFLAMLTMAKAPYTTWLRFIVPIYLALFAIAACAIVIAIRIGLN